MQISGSVKTTCPPEFLLQQVVTPKVLAAMLPVEGTFDQTAEGQIDFKVFRTIGPVRLTMSGAMTLDPAENGQDRVIKVQASHVVGGKVAIILTLSFPIIDGVPRLTYEGDLTATGLAGRVVNERKDRINKMVQASFSRLNLQASRLYKTTQVSA